MDNLEIDVLVQIWKASEGSELDQIRRSLGAESDYAGQITAYLTLPAFNRPDNTFSLPLRPINGAAYIRVSGPRTVEGRLAIIRQANAIIHWAAKDGHSRSCKEAELAYTSNITISVTPNGKKAGYLP